MRDAKPLGLWALWLIAETFASEMPGTAMVVGLLGLLAIAASIALCFYVLSE
jgi:hypothetical protein